MIIELPHALGREEARLRLQGKIGDIARHVPGGAANVSTDWLDQDHLALAVKAMGQTVTGTIEVEEQLMRITLKLPLMLSFLTGALTPTIQREGRAMLLEDKREA